MDTPYAQIASLLMFLALAGLSTITTLQIRYDFLRKSKTMTCLLWSATLLVIGPITLSTDCSVRLITTFFITNMLDKRE